MVVGGGGEVAKDEVFSVAIALQTKRAAMKAPGRNAEAADWRRGARDYGWMRARARLCTSPFQIAQIWIQSSRDGWRRNVAACASCARGRGRAH